MNRARVISIARKEFLHIIHDVRSLIILFLLPALQIIMFGYALNMEIQRIDLAVIDYDQSPASRTFLEAFQGSRFFHLHAYDGPLAEAEGVFLRREARAILIIPADFAKKLLQQPQTSVQVLIDATDPNAATFIRNYCAQVIAGYNAQHAGNIVVPFATEPRIWFNPDMKSAYFFVPGLLALILMMICALLTSITITREKEMGTMEQILVSPVTPQEIIIGKVLPYVILSLLDGFFILALGLLFFGVPFSGSFLLFVVLSTLYILVALSLGLLISTVTKTQQVAMMIAMITTLLPTLMLSGFIFPIPSMPKILQWISSIIPAKYYLVIVRGIMLKGNTLPQLWLQVVILLLMSLILLANARRKFQTTLER